MDPNVMQVDETYENSQPLIVQSDPRGCFSLQPQVPLPSYVGTQALQEYDWDCQKSAVTHSLSCSHQSKSHPQSVHAPSLQSSGCH